MSRRRRVLELLVRVLARALPEVQVNGRRLDPAVRALMWLSERSPPLDEMSPVEARRNSERVAKMMSSREPRVSVRTVPGPPRIRVYGEGRRALLYFHGGGFVVGSLDTHDDACRALATKANVVVASVDYRLAPEHPFPAPLEDAMAAWAWARESFSEVWVGGDSAGGNLAAVLSQTVVPRPRGQLLIYPAVDRSNASTESFRDYATGFGYTRAMNRWFMSHYLGGHDPADPRISPLLAETITDPPRAIVVTSGFDILRDQGQAYVAALRDAGAQVRHLFYPDLVHGFLQLSPVAPAAARAVDDIARALREDW